MSPVRLVSQRDVMSCLLHLCEASWSLAQVSHEVSSRSRFSSWHGCMRATTRLFCRRRRLMMWLLQTVSGGHGLRVYDYQQGVALMGRNTTGPPGIIRLEAAWRHHLACAGEAACRLAVECYRPRQTTNDDRRQRTKQYCPPYTMCRRASNKWRGVVLLTYEKLWNILFAEKLMREHRRQFHNDCVTATSSLCSRVMITFL